MLLKDVYRLFEQYNQPQFVLSNHFSTEKPGILYRWMCIDELLNVYWGDWQFVGFDDYAEEAHDPKYDDLYFKSFSKKETQEQNKDFFDEVLVAFDEKGLANLGSGTKLVDYVFDKDTHEYEKRLISPHVLLPKESIGGKYWQLVKAIYVPKSKMKSFDDNFLPEFEDTPELLPPWFVIKNM